MMQKANLVTMIPYVKAVLKVKVITKKGTRPQ